MVRSADVSVRTVLASFAQEFKPDLPETPTVRCADLDFWVAPISRQHNLIDELKKQELDTPPYDSLAILSDVTGSV
jgi:hypothetical protein